MKARIGVKHQAKGCQRLPETSRIWERGGEQILSHSPKGTTLTTPGSGVLALDLQDSLCPLSPSLGFVVTAALGSSHGSPLPGKPNTVSPQDTHLNSTPMGKKTSNFGLPKSVICTASFSGNKQLRFSTPAYFIYFS